MLGKDARPEFNPYPILLGKLGGIEAQTAKQGQTLANLVELAKGNIYTTDTDDDAAIVKTVPTGAARYAELEKWGGKTEVVDGELVSANVSGIVTKDTDSETIATVPVPAAVRALDGYGWGAGSAYNSVEWDAEQRKWFYHKRVGSVDLGTLSWFYDDVNRRFYHSASIGAKAPANTVDVPNILCATLESTGYSYATATYGDKRVSLSTVGGIGISYIASDGDAEAFKLAMNGVILYYELATEVVTDITDLMGGYDGTLDTEQGGTVEFVQSNSPALAVPSTVNYMVKIEEVL